MIREIQAGEKSVRVVFNDWQAMPLRNRKNPVHLAGHAGIVHLVSPLVRRGGDCFVKSSWRIPFNKPGLLGNELRYMADAISLGHTAGDGSYTARCHAYLEKTLGVPRALLTTSLETPHPLIASPVLFPVFRMLPLTSQ